MGENSKIEWTDNTFNPWVGCTRVSPGCDHCYAELWACRTGQSALWEGKRRRTTESNWRQVHLWNYQAQRFNTRPWVFCASLADVFDNEVPDEWRTDLWKLIGATPLLRWQLLTKRIGNVAKMLPQGWGPRFEHAGIMATVVNQEEADRDIPKLVALKRDRSVKWIGISYEPALGPLDLSRTPGAESLDWLIAGGESGAHARPAHPDWFRRVRDQCAAAGIPFMFKQWGQWHADALLFTDAVTGECPPRRMKVGKALAGRLLDGRTHDGFPTVYEPEKELANG